MRWLKHCFSACPCISFFICIWLFIFYISSRLSVLHHAALVGDHTLMKLLLENVMKVDVKDNTGIIAFSGLNIYIYCISFFFITL